jgi:hypothetical protein
MRHGSWDDKARLVAAGAWRVGLVVHLADNGWTAWTGALDWPWHRAHWLGGSFCFAVHAGPVVFDSAKGNGSRHHGDLFPDSQSIYLSGEIFVLGIAIMLWNFYLLGLLALIAPLQIWRAGLEARVLEERFGEQYRQYRARTWL